MKIPRRPDKHTKQPMKPKEEPTFEEMRKTVSKNINVDGMNDEEIIFMYQYIKALPMIEKAEKDSLAGES